MNSKIKLALFSLVLAFAGASALLAADDEMVSVAPSVPTAPSESARAGKAGKGGRLEAAAERRMEQLDQRLQLTADQKDRIKEIWKSEAGKALAAGAGKDRRAALMRSRDEVRAVLTPDQQARFDKMQPDGKAGKAGKAAPAQRKKPTP